MSQDYYRRRNTPSTEVSYEESYWGIIKDPDGNIRDRRSERERYLEDLKAELDFIGELPAGRVLDVGCGLGFLLSGISANWERHGVEVSAFAAEHASRYGKIYQGYLEDAGYPDAFFDLVVIYHVIEHVQDPQKLIMEIRRILKPGGWLILGTPDFDSGAARRYGENYRMLHDKTHISLFSNDSMHRFLRDHGFRIEKVEYPFFETRYFNSESLLALLDTSTISPPFYGNFMTFYCRQEALPDLKQRLQFLSNYISREGESLRDFRHAFREGLESLMRCGLPLRIRGEGILQALAEQLAIQLNVCGLDGSNKTFEKAPAEIFLTYLDGALRIVFRAENSLKELELSCPQDQILFALIFERI